MVDKGVLLAEKRPERAFCAVLASDALPTESGFTLWEAATPLPEKNEKKSCWNDDPDGDGVPKEM